MMMTTIKKNKHWIITLFILGTILLITAVYNIGYFQGQRQAEWRSADSLKECNDVIEQVKLSEKELIVTCKDKIDGLKNGYDYKINQLQSQYESSLEALNISIRLKENDTFIKGVSYSSKFYFVMTDGYNSSQIADIENHEICHQLIKRDQEHFCQIED